MKKLNISAPAYGPAKSRPELSISNDAIELVRLVPKWRDELTLFFKDMNASIDAAFFIPHHTDAESIYEIANLSGSDLYYLLLVNQKILGYGLLRGWDEGYEIPSLGVAIHPSARGIGLGELLISFLHALAIQRGAKKIRLRVMRSNFKAINLYHKLGYVFDDSALAQDYLIGFKILKINE